MVLFRVERVRSAWMEPVGIVGKKEKGKAMKIIATKRAKTDKYDRLRRIRLDGSETSTTMPRQGVLPHDLSKVDVDKVPYGGVVALSERWQTLAFYDALELDMPCL